VHILVELVIEVVWKLVVTIGVPAVYFESHFIPRKRDVLGLG